MVTVLDEKELWVAIERYGNACAAYEQALAGDPLHDDARFAKVMLEQARDIVRNMLKLSPLPRMAMSGPKQSQSEIRKALGLVEVDH